MILKRIYSILPVFIFLLIVFSCKGDETKSRSESARYHIGKWAGNIYSESYVVVADSGAYVNSAWKIESSIMLDEYNDGTFIGTITGDLFRWDSTENFIQSDFNKIAVGQWDGYSQYEFRIEGSTDGETYELHPIDVPPKLYDSKNPSKPAEFYDWIFPREIKGTWKGSEKTQMKGTSSMPQGEDMKWLTSMAEFRWLGVIYHWEINKL